LTNKEKKNKLLACERMVQVFVNPFCCPQANKQNGATNREHNSTEKLNKSIFWFFDFTAGVATPKSIWTLCGSRDLLLDNAKNEHNRTHTPHTHK